MANYLGKCKYIYSIYTQICNWNKSELYKNYNFHCRNPLMKYEEFMSGYLYNLRGRENFSQF